MNSSHGNKLTYFILYISVILFIECITGSGGVEETTNTECILNSYGMILDVVLNKNTNEKVLRTSLKINGHSENDWIGVWRTDPTLDEWNEQNFTDGKTRSKKAPLKQRQIYTDVTVTDWDILVEEDIASFGLNLSSLPDCLPYWAAYVSNDTIVFKTCLKLNPFWMEKLSWKISALPVMQLMFPGVEEEKLNAFSVMEKLIYGMRFLETSLRLDSDDVLLEFQDDQSDPRVSMTFKSYIDDIVQFLDQTKEIIVLNFYFNEESSNFCVRIEDMLMKLAKDFILPKDRSRLNPTVAMLWRSNKRLIVTSPQCKKSKIFWKQLSGINYFKKSHNSRAKTKLTYKLNTKIKYKSQRKSLWTLKIQNPDSSASSFQGHSEKYHHSSRSLIEQSFYDEFRAKIWQFVNIVQVSFPSSNLNIVKTAIDANSMKSECPIHQSSMRSPRNIHFNYSISELPKKDNKKCPTIVASDVIESSDVIKVWPTIRAMPIDDQNGSFTFRHIEINWKSPEILYGDYVAIFPNDPSGKRMNISAIDGDVSSGETLLPLFFIIPYATEGKTVTPIRHPRPSLFQLHDGGCVGVWTAFIRNYKVVSARCLQSYPRWIWQNRDTLFTRPLHSLVLPGSHNAGSYSTDDFIDLLSIWAINQDETILTQLLLGIRYLDLRVAYYPDTKEKLWINHDHVRMRPLRRILEDVKTFAHLSPDPVILDVHRTPVGFDDNEAPILLARMINSTLGYYLADASLGDNVTSADLWSTGETIIVSYGNKALRAQYDFLWEPIYQAWGDSGDANDLKEYLDNIIEGRRNDSMKDVWAAMTHLSPSIMDFFLNSGKGLRWMADRLGTLVGQWLLTDEWRGGVNVFCPDFILTTDGIFTAIDLNTECPDE